VPGPVGVGGNVAWLKGDGDAAARKTGAPLPDADRTEILADLERLEAQPKPAVPVSQAEGKGWLAGVKVLDLTNVIAGPTIASLLSRFGADVISVDPCVPLLDPWNAVVFGMQANRGKRSLLADIRSTEGREILNRILREVDVVTINAMDNQIKRLGITLEELHEINPNLILCQFDAYGGPLEGPRSNHSGYDDLAQATTGIMARFGGGIDTPEEHAHFGTIDVLGGYCAAFGIGMALVKRADGRGADVARASLAAAGQLIQIPFMYDYDGRAPFDEPSGRHIKGAHPLYRCYKAMDGWFFLAVDRDHLDRLYGVSGLADLKSIPEAEWESFLERVFDKRSCAFWDQALREADLGVQPLASMAGVREGYLSIEGRDEVDLLGPTFAFTRLADHPCGHQTDLVAPNAIRPRRSALTFPVTAPKYGADSRAVLSELGYGAEEVAKLIQAGAVAESWSRDYMPD